MPENDNPNAKGKISPELAALGFYLRSVKPVEDDFLIKRTHFTSTWHPRNLTDNFVQLFLHRRSIFSSTFRSLR